MTMAWVAVGTAVVGAASSAYSANKQSQAAKQAGNMQAQAAQDANATQLSMFNQQQAANEPFRQNGLAGQSEYMRMLGLQPYDYQSAAASNYDPGTAYLKANPDVAADPYWGANPMLHYQQHGQFEGRTWNNTDPNATPAAPQTATNAAQMQQDAFAKWRATPGYQFGFDEQQRALDASATARGGLFSGQAGKDLAKWSQGYADQQGYEPYMNKLASLAGMAQTATSQNAAAAQNYANQYGANATNGAAARASGLIGASNAQASGINNAVGMGMGALNQWASYRQQQPAYGGISQAAIPQYNVAATQTTLPMYQPAPLQTGGYF